MELTFANCLFDSLADSQHPFHDLRGFHSYGRHLTIGTFIAVFDLLNFIIGPSVYFPFMLNGLNRSIASINRIRRLESIPRDQNKKRVKAMDIPSINISGISFSYSGGKPAIQDFSLSHCGCGIIAVCGESGSGKTTLLDLISGFYGPECEWADKIYHLNRNGPRKYGLTPLSSDRIF